MNRKFCRNIVIATDGSENAQRAIFYGIGIAKLSEATVYALCVVNASSLISENWTIGRKNIYKIIRSKGEKAVSEVKKLGEKSGVEVKEVILDGNPSNEILDFSENNDIDLIVMGTLGKTGLDRFLIGSVAENVVRGSKVPVMVVRDV
ncbi:Universal stress protein [Methanosarcina lacustris Z-7289]|uniref:Universal stress protein n=1 Tax=Methanosarcina lacustris Z-7289 TaxID=1434111 RepID=A0A0E3S5C7_9EURY|nr:universal stress protein [Methanosarcina lacustris]AKB74412.1 Universal stress protein [Methanosarcina lacustris Z-7289]